ncbi:MAG: hypothetical protein ABIH23_32175 [bacterium]
MRSRTFVVFQLSLGLLTWMACESFAQSVDEKNLVVMRVPGSREVFIVPPDRPHCFVRHLSLESFSCRNWKEIPNGKDGVWGASHEWPWHDDGTITCTGLAAPDVPYQLSMVPHETYIEIQVTVTNDGNLTFEDLYAHMCMDIRQNLLMYDPTMERTFVQIEGKRRAMAQTDVADSINGVMPAYFLKTVPPADRWLPDALRRYGWDISSDVVDSPVVAIASKDGGWVAGLWFEPVHYVIGNYRPPHHGCIHSEPSFGTLRPGQFSSVTGRLYICAGTIDEIWQQMTRDWLQVRDN